MEYRVLGPLEVDDGEGPLALGGAQQRTVFLLLLLSANRVVSRDRLIDELWGDKPPATAVQSLQVYVSRLRKLLPAEALETRPPGYRLAIEPELLDSSRFRAAGRGGANGTSRTRLAVAAGSAGALARPSARGLRRAVRTGGGEAARRASDLLLDGLSQLVVEGLGPAAPTLRKAVSAFRDDEKVLQFGGMAARAAATLWDVVSWDAVITRQLQLARDAGALAQLATELQGKGIVVTWSGDFSEAGSVIAEADAVTAATGIRIASYGGMLLATADRAPRSEVRGARRQEDRP